MPKKGKGWEWEHGCKIIHADRNISRDRNIFRVPRSPAEAKKSITIVDNQKTEVISWQWPGDNRVFLVPMELFRTAKLGGITRDIISYAAQLYRDQKFPQDRKITTSARGIAEGIGMSWGSIIKREIDNCLAYARFFTIQNYHLIQELAKNGTIKTSANATFGFIDLVLRPTMINGIEIPKSRQWYQITLSEVYAAAIRTIPPAPVPLAALEAAHSAAWRLQIPAKNLVYYLSSRVPDKEIRLLLPTLRDICNFTTTDSERTDKARKSVENALKVLHPIMVENFTYKSDGYDIILSGNVKKDK